MKNTDSASKPAGTINKLIYSAYTSMVPPLTPEELSVAYSGDVAFEGSILGGSVDWDAMDQLPKPGLTAEEQAYVDGPIEELCAMLHDYEIEKTGDLPEDVWQFMKDSKLFGLEIPEKDGGLGFSSQLHGAVIVKLASRCPAAGVVGMVPNSLGPAKLIKHYGTDKQKETLPDYASGKEIPCFALTEPGAGSDATSIVAEGEVFKDKESGKIKVRLNFEKRFITLAPVATKIGIAFKLDDPDHLLSDKVHRGITLALLDKGTEGLETGRHHDPLGAAFPNGPLKGTDVEISLDQIIGGEEGIGKGWGMLVDCLNIGRAISLTSLSKAATKVSAQTTGAYAAIREQFKLPIKRFEALDGPLADIAGKTYMVDAAVDPLLQLLDGQSKAGETIVPAILGAGNKVFTTEAARDAINHAMDVQAGKAIQDGPLNLINRFYKSIPISITVEGANILTQNMIVYGQGVFRSHPFVMDEMKAISQLDKNKAANDLAPLLGKHVMNAFANIGKSALYRLTDAWGTDVSERLKGTEMKRSAQKLNRLAANFAVASDMTLTQGGKLRFNERGSGRLASAMWHIYAGQAALKKWSDDGQKWGDLPLVQWAVQHCLYEGDKALREHMDNYPKAAWKRKWSLNPKAAGLAALERVFSLAALDRIISETMPVLTGLPLSPVKKPSDKIEAKTAATITKPGAVRDRLTDGIYKPTVGNDVLVYLEDAFKLTPRADIAFAKARKAAQKGILQTDKDLMAEAKTAYKKVTAVDDFATLKR